MPTIAEAPLLKLKASPDSSMDSSITTMLGKIRSIRGDGIDEGPLSAAPSLLINPLHD
jgi:hypothetical protein